MRTPLLVLLCALLCAACARPLTTLSDGQPGYTLTCDTFRERCLDEITHMCQGNSYNIVSEKAQEIRPDMGWLGRGPYTPTWVHPSYNSRYWMEVRCDRY